MYMGGGGGGVERSPIKKSWGEGVKMKKLGVYMKKKIIGGKVCNCERSSPPPPPPHVHSNGIALRDYRLGQELAHWGKDHICRL